MSESNKKRKRGGISRSLPSSEDQQLDREHQNQSVERLREEIQVDDKDDNKSKKKKKRKQKKKMNLWDYKEQERSLKVGDESNNDGRIGVIEPAGKLTSAVQQRQNEHSLKNPTRETERSPKKKKRKKKKRAKQVLSSSVCSSDHPNNDDDCDGSKKDVNNENIADNNNEDGIVLEGSMVADSLVLIDRKAGRVYSATDERLQNGDRKQVGRLDGKGRVVLFPRTEERENGAN
jgi:hypothetical protein